MAEGASWRARVSGVETVNAQLGPIFGWEDQPLVSLEEATKKLPVKNIRGHAQIAAEAGEDFKFSHPDERRSEDQLGAVHLYSQAWPVAEDSLYAVLNDTLSNADRGQLVVYAPPRPFVKPSPPSSPAPALSPPRPRQRLSGRL